MRLAGHVARNTGLIFWPQTFKGGDHFGEYCVENGEYIKMRLPGTVCEDVVCTEVGQTG